jgi:hypothetical protein
MNPEFLAELAELVRRAASLAPLISPPAWAPTEHPKPGLAFDAPADRAAWIQLGVTIEAIDVAGSATGLTFSVDPYAGAPPLPVIATATTMSMTAHRLAACLRREVGSFRAAPLRLAAHVSARLASAAAQHDCTLAWFESGGALAELAAALPPGDLPPGASAVGVVAISRDERGSLVRGGRAACRVWLEAVSLGLAVQPVPSLQAAALARAELQVDGALVAALAFGAAA